MHDQQAPTGSGNGTLRINLFAGMADFSGCRSVEIEWSGGTVGDLRSRLAARIPAIEALLNRSAVAIAGAYAQDAADVPCGAEVAIIPPVSGG